MARDPDGNKTEEVVACLQYLCANFLLLLISRRDEKLIKSNLLTMKRNNGVISSLLIKKERKKVLCFLILISIRENEIYSSEKIKVLRGICHKAKRQLTTQIPSLVDFRQEGNLCQARRATTYLGFCVCWFFIFLIIKRQKWLECGSIQIPKNQRTIQSNLN